MLPAAFSRCAHPQHCDLLRVALCHPPSGQKSLMEVKELDNKIGGITEGPEWPGLVYGGGVAHAVQELTSRAWADRES